MKKRLLFLLLFFSISVFGQEFLFPLNRDMETKVGKWLNEDTTGFHSSIKPFMMAEVKQIAPWDSINTARVHDNKFNSTWVGRKLKKEHFVFVNEDELVLSVDPIFNLGAGSESQEKRNTYINTRGVLVQGDYKGKFFFYTSFRENQGRFANYVDSVVTTSGVVPGQGRVKFLKDRTYDFSQSFGGIAYVLNKHFDFLLAHDKNFIGDGYRSLLLSDNAYNYPFLRINMSFWKFRYTVLYTVMQDLSAIHDPDIGFQKKYSTTHYLNLNIGKRNKLSVGIFETVLFKPAASRGYELAYLNPMIFLRPVENSLDSPDNELLGLNLRWKINAHNTLYGQLMLDELLLGEVRSGKGWWGNKQGFQIGYKSFEVFAVKNLNVQTEFNLVRPYTYQHRSDEQNYTHYNQALAHPLGANFIESISFLNYRYKHWFAEVKVQIAEMGRDTGGVNFGNNIFLDYNSRPYEYGHYLFSGQKTSLRSIDVRLNYLVNPKTNFNIEIGMTNRDFSNSSFSQKTNLIYFGIRTSLENFYYDF